MTPLPVLQICLRPPMTLNIDLLTPKLNVSRPCPVKYLCVNLQQNWFFVKYPAHNIGNGRKHYAPGQSRLAERHKNTYTDLVRINPCRAPLNVPPVCEISTSTALEIHLHPVNSRLVSSHVTVVLQRRH